MTREPTRAVQAQRAPGWRQPGHAAWALTASAGSAMPAELSTGEYLRSRARRVHARADARRIVHRRAYLRHQQPGL